MFASILLSDLRLSRNYLISNWVLDIFGNKKQKQLLFLLSSFSKIFPRILLHTRSASIFPNSDKSFSRSSASRMYIRKKFSSGPNNPFQSTIHRCLPVYNMHTYIYNTCREQHANLLLAIRSLN